MKVMFLTNEYPPTIYGGAGVHVDYLSRALTKYMAVDVRAFGNQEDVSLNLKVKGYGFDEGPYARCDSKLKSPLSAMNRCLHFNADPVDADVVHCHTWYSHFGGILAKLGHGIPLVVSTHSLEPHRPWKKEQIGLGYNISSWVEKTALEMADGIIAVSEGMKKDVLNLFNVREEKIHVIYNGIDTQEYSPAHGREALQKFGVEPNAPYVLFVGRITRQKGIIHLVNAIKYLDQGIQVVLAAGAPDTEAIGREMEEKVKAVQQTRNNIVWIREWVDTPQKVELYTHAAVFCCPSIYEPFGIINLEAMACGTPVVGTAVGGIREIILEGKTGYLIPLQQQDQSPFEAVDPEQFARDLAGGINKLAGDAALSRRMGEASRKRAVDSFSWNAIARQTFEFYGKLTGLE